MQHIQIFSSSAQKITINLRLVCGVLLVPVAMIELFWGAGMAYVNKISKPFPINPSPTCLVVKFCTVFGKAFQFSLNIILSDIKYFFYIGGNDSSDTVRIVSERARAADYPLRCVHVPKTIDNDLMENDHTPGFPSASSASTSISSDTALDFLARGAGSAPA